MEFREVKLVYAAISTNDNRNLDESIAAEWHRAIERNLAGRATLQDCMVVVEEWFDVDRGKYFTKGVFLDLLRKRLRLLPKAIQDDVRSAKARGLVAGSWPRDKPVPVEAAAALEQFRAEARALAPELEPSTWESPLQLDVGRRV